MSTPCIQGDNIAEIKTQQALSSQSIKTMNEKLDDLKNSVEEIKTNLLFLINKTEQEVKEFKQKADQDYAGKWIEKVIIGLFAII